MTVRTWFRLLRATQWDAQGPVIDIYFRSDLPARCGPLTPGTTLRGFTDYLTLIEHGAPITAFERVRRDLAKLTGVAD